MIAYRMGVGACVVALGVAIVPVRGQEPPAPQPAETAAPAPPAKKQDPFFGDRFAMYLEVRGGPASIDAFQNPVVSGADSSTLSEVSFDGSMAGLFTIGWTLPRDRGRYLFTYNGLTDGDYEVEATGYQRSYRQLGGGSQQTPLDQMPWWQLTVQNGQLHTTETPPVWDSGTDDADFDGFPDRDEIRFPATVVDVTATVPESLNNRVQTFDLYYRREFGGLRYRGAWTAGARYLDYDGAVPCPAWVIGSKQIIGFGFTEGVSTKMLLMQESAKGWGPMGGGEVQFNFFRQRLSLYLVGQAALLISELNTDSGPFTYYAYQSLAGSLFVLPGTGHLQQSVSKTAWNTMIEVGARVKVLEGFHVILDWNTTGYLDTVLLPDVLSVPATASQVPQGTVSTYVSRDIVRSTINLGLSFQF